MQKTITLPSVDTGSNYTNVSIGRFDLYFSYRTLIAFRVEGSLYVRYNSWGSTTGKHLTAIDGGSKEAKAKRMSSSDFETAYVQHVASYVD